MSKEDKSMLWDFKAIDSFFFRDGSPYNAGEGGQAGVRSSFPPNMNTVQGAVRTALAYGQGWMPGNDDSWPKELGTPDDTGDVVLKGPYLMQNGKVLLPAPLYLMYHKGIEGEKAEYTRLNPGPEVEFDLGRRRLPIPRRRIAGAMVLENGWLNMESMGMVLNGGLPEKKPLLQKDLYHEEYRVGIEREYDSRTAAIGKIYSCVHVRPARDISLTVLVSGVQEHWQKDLACTIPLGGEGRHARVKICEPGKLLPDPGNINPVGGAVRFTVSLITPGRYQNLGTVINNGLPGFPGRCVSACIGKLIQVGGWDSYNSRPRPIAPFIPPGSTWFYEAGENELEKVLSLHGQNFGDKYGYGQIVVGSWEE